MSLSPRLAVAVAVVFLLPAIGGSSIGHANAKPSATVNVAPTADAAIDRVVGRVATPIPEPTTLAPLAGMAIVAMRRRRADGRM